jgi:hypothetical protein
MNSFEFGLKRELLVIIMRVGHVMVWGLSITSVVAIPLYPIQFIGVPMFLQLLQ